MSGTLVARPRPEASLPSNAALRAVGSRQRLEEASGGEPRYRMEPLTQAHVADWLSAAGRCPYAPANALDESLLRRQLADGRAGGNLVFYDQKSGQPVAVFPGEPLEWRRGPLRVRGVVSRFGGLMIAEEWLAQAPSLKAFAFDAAVGRYYPRVLKTDYLEVHTPPKLSIELPALVHAVLPFSRSHVEVNSMLYVQLEGDFLVRFKPTVRREILKGLEHLRRASLVRSAGEDERLIEHLVELEAEKAAELGIAPCAAAHFRQLIEDPWYHPLVALLDGRPAAAVISTCSNGVATFSFNASTRDGKRLFLNKALLYTAMLDNRARAARYFVLGNGRETPGWRIRHGASQRNVPNVTFFKRSMATHEAACYRFLYPLTPLGQVMTALSQWQARHDATP